MPKRSSVLIIVLWCTLPGLLLCAQEKVAPAAAGAPGRYVDTPDLMSIVKPVLTPQGMMDPEFQVAIAKPSPYLTDFFGIQAIKDVTKEQIKRDFVPKYAAFLKEDEQSIELKFKDGPAARFVVNSSLDIKGARSPISHVYLGGETWKQSIANCTAFLQLLKTLKLENHYLIRNPEYEDELAVDKKLKAGVPRVLITYDPDLQKASQDKNALVIFPDVVHGNEQGFSDFLEFMKNHTFDWVGLEAAPTSSQKDLDTYITAKENSPEFASASKAVAQSLAGWDARFSNTTESHFMKLMQLMRSKKTRVVALEGARSGSSLDFIIWRYGETPFGGAVRSFLWAQHALVIGRGLVFGGSAHFTSDRPMNFQDFMYDRNKANFYTPVKFGPWGK